MDRGIKYLSFNPRAKSRLVALMDPSPRHTTNGGSGRQGGGRSSKEAHFFLPSFFQVQLNPTVHLGSILSKSQGISHIASDLFHSGPCSERIKED